MLTGATWNNQTSDYQIISSYGTSLFQGDPVTFLNTGGIGIAVGGAAASQGPTLGVFMGCTYLLNGSYVYAPFWPAGTVPDNATNATAFVIDDPNVVFKQIWVSMQTLVLVVLEIQPLVLLLQGNQPIT
jgi:ABC-type transporter lipoprotein component MlaA